MSEDDKKQKVNQNRKILSALTKREEEILRKRFGIKSDKEKTLDEVGKDYKITRKEIREIEEKALKKLREIPSDDAA
jgi:RNA polymerase primary sigma factor